MRKATATYVAPPGDSKVCEMGGVTFFDGKPVELNSYDHDTLISNLEGNQHFDITVGKEEEGSKPPVKKRGRPSAVDKAAAKALAEETERLAKEAADKAKAAKEDLAAVEKAAAAAPPAAVGGLPPTALAASQPVVTPQPTPVPPVASPGPVT